MGLMKYVLAVFVSLSLLSVSMVRSQPPPPCPINNTTGLFWECVRLVEAMEAVESSSCCSRLQGLSPDEASTCINNDNMISIIVFPGDKFGNRFINRTVNVCGLTN
ncbi:hypothetical protein V8G54_006141 [Vigna mungo]|uniref:Bifunctional inhibitor/plant lipid transfer protein/seed storage helical domain-containing protein n=1 Tax=Vigna mungo TaxID=3915 RepID=A0AAQ3S4A3_VIGMU